MLGVVVALMVAAAPWWYGLGFVVAMLVVVPPAIMLWERKLRPAIARRLVESGKSTHEVDRPTHG